MGGTGEGAARPPLFWVKKEDITEGRKEGRASKTHPPHPTPPPLFPLARGLDRHCVCTKLKYESSFKLAVVVHVLQRFGSWQFHVHDLERTATKCAKVHNEHAAHADPLFCTVFELFWSRS